MREFTTYGKLKKGDVIIFYGANVRIMDVRIGGICDNDIHKGERIINFDIEPYDKEALQVLGKFYGYGTYGGVESITIFKVK